MAIVAAILLGICVAPLPRVPPADDRGSGYFGVYLSSDDTNLTITELVKDGPAEASGLRVGDVLIRVDRIEADDRDKIRQVISALRPGSRIEVVVRRQDKQIPVKVRVGEKPPDR